MKNPLNRMSLKNALVSLLVIFSCSSNAQVEQGNFLADAYIMGPTANTFGQVIWPNALTRDSYRRLGSTVGFGLRAEYMLFGKMSIGLEGNYAFGGYQYQDDYFNNQTFMNVPNASHQARYTKIRGLISVNFYFYRNENFTIYTGGGIGYYGRTEKYTIDGEDVNSFGSVFFADQNVLFPFQLPVTGRIQMGGKYFFTDNIGAFIEAGIGGGAVLKFGLATKF